MFNLKDTTVNLNNIQNVSNFSIFNADKLNNTNIGQLDNAEDNSILVYDGENWIWQSGGGGGGSSFLDSEFNVKNSDNNTKQMRFYCGDIPDDTTVTLTVPSFGGTILTNPITDINLFIQDNTNPTKQMRFECGNIPDDTTVSLTVPSSGGTILTNPVLETTFIIQDITGTKTISFSNISVEGTVDFLARIGGLIITEDYLGGIPQDIFGITNGYNFYGFRYYTDSISPVVPFNIIFPNRETSGDLYILSNDSVSTITNKTLFISDENLYIEKRVIFEGDLIELKTVKFNCSNITNFQTRTLTIPNYNDTIAVTSSSQTLSNKTLDIPIIKTLTNTEKSNITTPVDGMLIFNSGKLQCYGNGTWNDLY